LVGHVEYFEFSRPVADIVAVSEEPPLVECVEHT
jgi:hypothetical protein